MNFAYFAQQALFLSVLVALPVLLATAAVGLFVAALQAATQIQDATLAHVPRLLATCLALAAFAPWMARMIARFALDMFRMAAS